MPSSEAPQTMDEIIEGKFSDYRTYLKEPSRPPSRGGNTSALHAHVLVISGTEYSFLALGSRSGFTSQIV